MALWVGCGGGGGVAVQSPHVVANTRPVDLTEQAILDTLPRRGWTAEAVQPGRIIAFLALRNHLLRVEIRYDPQQVAIYYVDSDNLRAHIEPNGVIYGHKAINSWTMTLARDIQAALLSPPPPTSGGVMIPPPPPPPPQ
jgi:hypothetical protein